MTRTWPALLTIHVAWSVHLVVSYYLAWSACASDDGWLLALRHLATVLAAGAVVAAIWHEYQAMTSTNRPPPAGRDGRSAFGERVNLARVTLVLSAVYLLGIVLTGSANLFLAPCV